jgi:glycosyltransferase involved in cell wall biosynthesis
MKVLLLTPMPPDPQGGGAIPALLHAQLVGLRERHDVTVITVAGPDPAEIARVEALRAEGVEVRAVVRRAEGGSLGWPRRRRIAGAWARGLPLRTAWFAEPGIQALIDGSAADALLAEDNAMGLFSGPPGVPSVLTEYEVRRRRPVADPPHDPRRWPNWGFAELDWRRWPGYQARVWRRFDAVQLFSERDAAAAAALAPALAGRFTVNPFAIEPPAAAAAGEEDPETLAFAGNFSHPPNVDAVLWLAREVLPLVARERPGARLVIAGPQAPASVRALAGDRVEVLGFVEDLDALLRRAAVVMAPVRTGGGMRMKVLHAMALGKAVVTTPRGTEGLASGGRVPPLVVGEDARALAAATAALLAEPARRAELGAQARAFVDAHHTPRAYVERLEATLELARASRASVRRSSPVAGNAR